MTTPQTLVGLGGAGLILVNYWTGTQRKPVTSLLQSGSSSTASIAAAHSVFVELGGELLFVVIATVIAGISDGAGKGILAAITALWILWAITYFSGPKGAKSSSSSMQTPAKTTGTVAGAK